MMHRVFRLVVPALVTPALFAQSGPASLESTSWYAEVTRKIQREEYEFRELAAEPGVWAASNRSQGFRARVSSAGVDVSPREPSAHGREAGWTLRLATVSFGRVGDTRVLETPVVSIDGTHRAHLDYGRLLEYLENGEDGLEQGWIIEQRPRGVEPLWIGLDFAGALSVRIGEGARSAVLVDACGDAQLRYRDLLVFDADGRELPARLESSPIGIGIEIDDRGARYPLTVDPMLSGPAWSVDSDQAGADLGWSLSTAGDINGDGFSDVLVAAWSYDTPLDMAGRVFLYLGSAAGLSTSVAWTADGDQSNAWLGWSVSTAGDVNGDGFSDVILGAINRSNNESLEGAAYVYLGSSSGLASSPAWSVESNQTISAYGDVATAGDVNGDGFSDVIVGAHGYTNTLAAQGRVFLYLGSGAGLSTTPAWTAESDKTGCAFGSSLSSAGDVNADGYADVIVGAERYTNPDANQGRAYVYLGSSSGLGASPAWTGRGAHRFGRDVSAAGDVNADGYGDVIIGAPGEGGGGSAFVYYGSASGLTTVFPSADWITSSSGRYGWSVDTAGDFNGDGVGDVVVSERALGPSLGSARVYFGSSTGLSTSVAWFAQGDPLMPGSFGHSVTTAGDVNGDGYSDFLVSAPTWDDGQASEGRAYLYLGFSGLPSLPVSSMTHGDQISERHGYSVADAGDVNGDGFSDVIVGAYGYGNGEPNEGRALVYLGTSTGLATSPAWSVEGNQSSAIFGSSVGTAGDVNGDGYSDVIVDAQWYDNGETNEGRAFVYTGSSSGLGTSPAWTAESNQANAGFGFWVTTAGDVDGDGFSDVLISANTYDNGQTDEGRVFVYTGSASGLSATPAWTVESNQASSQFGVGLSSAGDVNADGFSDVIVGASLYDNGQVDEGAAFLYLGSSEGLATTAAWSGESNQTSGVFGIAVSTAGDVNGDGFSDVIVGVSRWSGSGVTEGGRVCVYLGSPSGLATSPASTPFSTQASSQFGRAVSTAGDVNGDGFSDVLVGAPASLGSGQAFVYLGSASGLASSAAAWTGGSGQANTFYGQALAGADVNGDGLGDVIVGAWQFTNDQPNDGAVFVHLGNEGRGGWTRAPRQRRSNDSAPIGLLGRSQDTQEFRIALRLEEGLAGFRWATGLAPRARLEWQVAPLGAPFSATDFESGPDQPISALPLAFNELAQFVADGPNALPNGTAHHQASNVHRWRARVRTNNPVFPVTPWVSFGGNNRTETKLRTGNNAPGHGAAK